MSFEYAFLKIEGAQEYENLPGPWVCAVVDHRYGWPSEKALLNYMGRTYLVQDESETVHGAISSRAEEGETEDQVRSQIVDVINVISWMNRKPIHIKYWCGGGRPIRAGKSKQYSLGDQLFDYEFIPRVCDEKTSLALSFFREALHLDNIPYKFLSFYKIINLFYRSGDKQKRWIRRTIPRMFDGMAKERAAVLAEQNETVEEYLYVTCRCAIAHAGVNPTINPDNWVDIRRLTDDLPLIQHLAELMIEEQSQIPTLHSYYNQHYYETYGIPEMIGADLTAKVSIGERFPPFELQFPISLRLKRSPPFSSLERMIAQVHSGEPGNFSLHLKSTDSRMSIEFLIDLQGSRILFDPCSSFELSDDSSFEAIQHAICITEFRIAYFQNGILQLFNSDTGQMYAFCDAYIPVNIMISEVVKQLEETLSYLHKLRS